MSGNTGDFTFTAESWPRVVIVGVGALGSHLVQFLRNVRARVRVVDFDRVERKNVLSQFHAKSTAGKLKVAGLAQTMKFLYRIDIEAVPTKLTTDNVEVLLEDADLIIDCVDNIEARQLIKGFVAESGTPCLHGALAADGSFGRVAWDEGFEPDSEAEAGAPTCEGGEHLPFIALTASLLARAAQAYLETGRKVGFQIPPTGAVFPV